MMPGAAGNKKHAKSTTDLEITKPTTTLGRLRSSRPPHTLHIYLLLNNTFVSITHALKNFPISKISPVLFTEKFF